MDEGDCGLSKAVIMDDDDGKNCNQCLTDFQGYVWLSVDSRASLTNGHLPLCVRMPEAFL